MIDAVRSETTTPLFERRTDAHGNNWTLFPQAPKQNSILSGPVTSRFVITSLGQELLHEIGEEDTLRLRKQIADRRLVADHRRLGKIGFEGDVRKVFDASSVTDLLFKKLRGAKSRVAVKKEIGSEEADLPLGWEIVQLYDALRPTFENHGMHLVQPLGATNQELFTPFVDGQRLDRFLWNNDAGTVTALLEATTQQLHVDLFEALTHRLAEQQFQLISKGTQLVDNTPAVFDSKISGQSIRALIDVHNAGMLPHKGNRYRNWVVPKANMPEIETLAKNEPTRAFEQLRDTIVCVDPVLLGRPK